MNWSRSEWRTEKFRFGIPQEGMRYRGAVLVPRRRSISETSVVEQLENKSVGLRHADIGRCACGATPARFFHIYGVRPARRCSHSTVWWTSRRTSRALRGQRFSKNWHDSTGHFCGWIHHGRDAQRARPLVSEKRSGRNVARSGSIAALHSVLIRS